MRPATPISQEQIDALEAHAPKIKSRKAYRRFQSVFLRAKDQKSPEAIAEILGIHPRTVQKHQQRYFKEGLNAFKDRTPGRKEPECLTPSQEADLFQSLEAEAAEGQLVTAKIIWVRFEEKAGKPCSKNTIYRAIHRNGWSKKQPRPRHPKGDEEAKTLFKKTL
jgi:transposase